MLLFVFRSVSRKMITTAGRQIGADEQQPTAATVFDHISAGQTTGDNDGGDGGSAMPPH